MNLLNVTVQLRLLSQPRTLEADTFFEKGKKNVQAKQVITSKMLTMIELMDEAIN